MLINQNFCLKPFTTFGTEVRAKRYAVISSVADLHELYESRQLAKKPVMVLGGGSNVLFTDHFNGLILSCQIRGKNIISETDKEILIKVGGGEYWPSFVDEMVAQGYGGVENLSLIPGKVGAAPIQNIGAYDVELKDINSKARKVRLKL
jgi:UDP-N-acetylmuramate dehydrogenase